MIQFLEKIWTSFQHGILPGLGNWNYVILACLVAVEGPIATLLGAAASSTGILKAPIVFAAAAAGNLGADMVWYSVGRLGKPQWILKVTRILGIRQHHLDTLQKGMADHSRKILFIAKLTAGLIIPSLIAAGLARVPVKRWFPFLFLAETIWTATLVGIGYYATMSIVNIQHRIEFITLAGTILILLLVIIWLQRRFRKSKAYPALLNEKPGSSLDNNQ